ncbi:MAG: glutamate--cysteine ligase [Acidimicrobiia bacterium]|nr:glutamate--cysteine ligase [Acidimicrobiia bacterium]
MQIDFNGSERASVGVEWELMLVERGTGDLANMASRVLDELARSEAGAATADKAKHELFENTIEVITGVCTTVAEAREDLRATVAAVHRIAGCHGLALMCAGTHPFAEWHMQTVTDDERYLKLVEEMQWLARRLLIFGVHVHVGVRGPEKAIAIANALSTYIPHFLALSASSPYWRGHDTGLESARSKLFEALPTAGLPYQLSGWDEFEQFMTALVSVDAIASIREVWWDIRPHPDFGTVELRMCDGLPRLDDVVAVAALAQSMVAAMDAAYDRGEQLEYPRPWILKENKWRAARHGLDAELITDTTGGHRNLRDAVGALVTELAPTAAELGCGDELAGVRTMLDGPSSSDRQRRVAAESGDVRAVPAALVAELEASTGLGGGDGIVR